MPKPLFLTDIWQTLKEVDLRPLRQQALTPTMLAIVGDESSGHYRLAEQLRRDPSKPEETAHAPLILADLGYADTVSQADAIILVVNFQKHDSTQEQALVQRWHAAGKKTLVCINAPGDSQGTPMTTKPWKSAYGSKGVVVGSVEDTEFLTQEFSHALMHMLPERLLSLGRHYPLLRTAISQNLIHDTCLTNAAYAFSTALAETIAVLDLPMAVADMIVLSKNQAYLVYKLGLALGFSPKWQDYLLEFGSVLGGGFFWRQVARTLVGWIPVWGIIPKTAVAYAGTYAIGHAVLYWYLTGRQVTRRQMQELYRRAYETGKEFARSRIGKLRQLRGRKEALLPEQAGEARRDRRSARKNLCPRCARKNPRGAKYCAFCGLELTEKPDEASLLPPPKAS